MLWKCLTCAVHVMKNGIQSFSMLPSLVYLIIFSQRGDLIRKNFSHPNTYISNSFRKMEFLLLILIKINIRTILYVVKKILFFTERGDF